MQNSIRFSRANLSVREVAQALGMDVQSVRVLLQTGAVSWGQAIKKPGSKHFMYLISPKLFFEKTGVLLGAEIDGDLAQDILRTKIKDLDCEIADAPEFLAEELQAERHAYAAHLAWLKENERNDGEGRV